MKLSKIKFVILLIVFALNCVADSTEENVEGLKKQLIQASEINKGKILVKLAKAYYFMNDKETISIKYAKEALIYTERFKQFDLMVYAYGYLSQSNRFLKNYKDAINYANKGIQIAEKIKDKNCKYFSLDTLRWTYLSLRRYNEAIPIYKTLLAIAVAIRDKKKIALNTHMIGTMYSRIEDNKNALEYYKQASFLYKELDDIESHLQMRAYIGRMYTFLGEHKKAQRVFREALKESEERGASFLIYRFCRGLGLLHEEFGEYQRSQEYYKKIEKLSEKLQGDSQKSMYLRAFLLRSSLYLKLKKYNEVINYYIKSINLKFKNTSTYEKFITEALWVYGNAYYEKKNYDKALEIFSEGLGFSIKYLEEKNQAIYYKNIGKVYIKKKSYENAQYNLEKSLKVLNRVNETLVTKNKKDLMEIYLLLSELYKKLGKSKKSEEYLKNANKL